MLVGNLFGSDGLIVVVIALIVVFGGSQLPKIAKNVGSAGKEFRKAQQEFEAEHKAQDAASTMANPQPLASQQAPAPQVTAAPQPQPSDSVTLSKADLEALLDERLGKGGSSNS